MQELKLEMLEPSTDMVEEADLGMICNGGFILRTSLGSLLAVRKALISLLGEYDSKSHPTGMLYKTNASDKIFVVKWRELNQKAQQRYGRGNMRNGNRT